MQSNEIKCFLEFYELDSKVSGACSDGLLKAEEHRNTGNRRNGYGRSVWRSASIQKTPGAGNQVFISSG